MPDPLTPTPRRIAVLAAALGCTAIYFAIVPALAGRWWAGFWLAIMVVASIAMWRSARRLTGPDAADRMLYVVYLWVAYAIGVVAGY
ncbi:hypothetical protein [Enhygromyxa salina]|uniref:hypothetical protein n=1 Tax=Enhygromyxa salina TaxID=215803 RepID=UPI0011BA53D4|nr:hypothetical protein [Enhygromyxa salina]